MARSNLTRTNPMTDMVRSGMIPNIEDIFREFSMVPALRALEQVPRMRVDVEENDQAYILRADVPGVKREDIVVSIDRNIVSITADVVDEQTEQKRHMLRTERVFGEEFRTFTFPQEIDASKAEAAIDNGILILTLPKRTGTGGTKLNINQKSASESGQGQLASGSAQKQSASGPGQEQSAGSSAQRKSS